MRHLGSLLASCGALALLASVACAQDRGEIPAPEATEVWEPVPPVVTPGPAGDPVPPPSDAIVLFDGSGLAEWTDGEGGPAGWRVADGIVTVDKSAGDMVTRRRFRDFQLHLEWRVPADVTGEGQARGNSGVFLAHVPGVSGYELQILDSFRNATYVNGMAGSIYKQGIPLANPSRPPGQWQVYDVIWTAPRFHPDGSLAAGARVTVLFNGVLVQRDFVLAGDTRYRGAPESHAYVDAPIMLQAHGDPSPPLSFRNIWVRPLE